ncbi:hypothetical protein B0H16DRAFT_1602957, partial [Mycena metata]
TLASHLILFLNPPLLAVPPLMAPLDDSSLDPCTLGLFGIHTHRYSCRSASNDSSWTIALPMRPAPRRWDR